LRSRALLHVSRHLRDLSVKIARIKEEYLHTYHHEISKENLLEQLDITPYDLSQVENLKVKPCSFTDPKSGQEHLMICDVIEDPKSSIYHLNNRLCLQDAMNSLKKEEKWLIEQRYYLDKTQQEIASELFLSQAQVSRMEKRILQQLKEFFI